MGTQMLSPVLPREVTPELRSLTETVWRLLQRDGSQAALRVVSRALDGPTTTADRLESALPELSKAGVLRRPFLLNLRGIVQGGQHNEDEALEDLLSAITEAPSWHVPWYNLGLLHKEAHRWQQAVDAFLRAQHCASLRRIEVPRPLLWNLGIAFTALQRWREARHSWHACGLPTAGVGDYPPEMDLGLSQLSLPTRGVYAAERVWVQRIDPARARILSVVRYGAPCQFGDVVLCDSGEGHTGYWDGISPPSPQGPGQGPGQVRSGDSSMIFLDVVEAAGFALHVVQGDPTSAAQATALTERLREADLHIEVWSLTMRLPDDPRGPQDHQAQPLCAGLVLPYDWQDPQRAAERAMRELQEAAQELGLRVYSPSLMEAARDEVGAARHRKALRQFRAI